MKETKKLYIELHAELERIKQDAELLPDMFQAEAQFRITCKEEANKAREDMNKALKEYDQMKKTIKDLTEEVERKKRLSFQAIAARGNMKQHLDEAKKSFEDACKQIEDFKAQLEMAAKDVERYKMKHDEMFSSVSGLNQRIEELEQHKLHLLNKLKTYGDRGDLGYIVKT